MGTIHDPRCGLFVTENITEVFGTGGIPWGVWGKGVSRDSLLFCKSETVSK